MRAQTAILLCMLIVALLFCTVAARLSNKAMSRDVTRLLVALLPPMIGNCIIILSSDPVVSTAGYYMYFLGMNLIMYSLLEFTYDYCSLRKRNRTTRYLVISLLILDALQLLLNPIFGHAFTIRAIEVAGSPYYSLVPLVGQALHRVVDYGLFAVVLVIFLYKTLSAPKIYVERFLVIFAVMVFAGAWQTYYVFSRTPIDRSMIGFGVFGLLIFYFALFYRPVRLLDSMLARLVSELGEALYFFDMDGTCIYVNTVGKDLILVTDDTLDRTVGGLHALFGELLLDNAAGEWSTRTRIGTGDNTRYYALERRTVFDDKHRPIGSLLSVRDRTIEQEEIYRESYASKHDELTGLYNKSYLFQCIGERLIADKTTPYMIVALDVKDFKVINDIYDTEFGDSVLRRIAAGIEKLAGNDWLYGRLSGDKFGALVPKADFDVDRMSAHMETFCVSDGNMARPILLHAGVYEVRRRDAQVSVMFDRAFMAMATVKNDFKTHIAFYDDDMREQVVWSQTISAQLNDAIAERQLRPYLQPMVDASGHVVGAEALVRWIHPTEGFISPARFVPIFERNGMIAEVDRYMWRCACEILADWRRRGIDLFLSVNISPKDFYFMDVFEVITGLVREFDIDPAKMRLEITETVMMTDLENRLRMLNNLRAYGFLVEMDDFGSGYSSLNMLKDMPVDVLKIDMMFLYKTEDQFKARTILRNIINLSGDLGMLSLTEGVETSDQYRMLADMGCMMFQGYYFARPMPQGEFEEFCGQVA